jgi:VWFA-related protein
VIEFALVLTLLAQAEAPARAAAPTQEPTPPVFGGEVEQVTVDAVVVDKQGNPVNGLTKDDFTVLDEGRPRQVVSFDLVDLPAGPPPPAAAAARARPRLATNLAPPGPPGRTFVIVFDNLHLSPLNAQRAKAAIASFLDKGSRAGDRVMLLATGGGAWWSTRLPEGRPDLLAILKGLEGRRIPENAQDRLTDFEAVRISVYRDAQVAARVQDRLERYGSKARQDMQQSQQRQKDSQDPQTPGMIDLYIESRANEAYLRLKSRMGVTFAALERALKPLSASRDRKAVLLVSEGFVMDNTQEGFNHVEEAARRANAALYFVDTRGLEGLSNAYSVEFGASLDERNLMSAIADVSQEGEGAAGLANDTGGFAVRNVNDLTAGVSRIGRESSRYYLLGFNPVDIPLDGRFRKIEVKVRGKGLTVRARRGYYAPGTAAKAEKRPEKGEADLQVAFDAPGFLDAIPLRMTSYVMQETTLGRARVLMVADIDVSKLAYQDAEGKSTAVLDTLLAVAHRDSGEIQRDDQKVDLERRPGVVAAGPAWYQVVRDFDLTAGGYQAKLVVRDAQSRRIGTVAYEFEVPVLDQFRVSTPILTDAVQTPRGQSALLPVVLARRTFAPGDSLYCRFDVFGAEKDKAQALPRVRSGNLVRRIDGTVVSRSAPTWIEPTSLGALSRMLRISLGGYTPGDYELVLTVEDALGGKTSELVEPFRLEYPDARPAAAGR